MQCQLLINLCQASAEAALPVTSMVAATVAPPPVTGSAVTLAFTGLTGSKVRTGNETTACQL
jgi:predicted MFS family arabinose efflux permease